jgi:hypothetical protein
MQMPADQRFAYSVQPRLVACSVDHQQRSTVSLTITAANLGAKPVDCPRLRISIPSDSIDKEKTLTTDPTTITVDVGEATPWAIFTNGDGVCYAVPLPPATGIAAGGSAEFIISNIVVNTIPGTVDITILQAPDPPLSASVQVTKERRPAEVSAAPQIVRFDVTPGEVALGDSVDVAWEVTHAQACTLAPGPVTLPSPVSGAVRLPVIHTTNFSLRALGTGGSATATRTVIVSPVEISEFASIPPGPVTPGQAVTLRWQTRFASSRSISQGIGAVPPAGEKVVTVTRTTAYTLTAAGLDQQERTIVVEVHA